MGGPCIGPLSEVQGSFKLTELETVGFSLARDLALAVVIAVSVE